MRIGPLRVIVLILALISARPRAGHRAVCTETNWNLTRLTSSVLLVADLTSCIGLSPLTYLLEQQSIKLCRALSSFTRYRQYSSFILVCLLHMFALSFHVV